MFMPIHKKFELTNAQEQLLRTTTIDDQHPGSILRDFQTLINFMAETEPQLTTTLQLSMRSLEPLNSLMTRPLQHGLTRPQQKSFPHINGLFWLLRASGLTRVDVSGSKPRLVLDEQARQSWESLNPTERYCTLLELWTMRAAPEIINDRSGFGMNSALIGVRDLWTRIPDDGMVVDRDKAHLLTYFPGYHNVALLEMFGWLEVRSEPAVAGIGWRIASLHRTAFGDALLTLLQTVAFGEADDDDETMLYFRFDHQQDIPTGVLQPGIQPYFPAWQHNLVLPGAEFRPGLFVFKAALGKDLWRRISIPAEATLDELSDAILMAYKFDDDHLYRFVCTNRFGAQNEYNHPIMEEPPFTSEVRIGDLPLSVGESMLYNFDFGDNWEFTLILERIDAPNPRQESAKILERVGRSPKQYRY
jgi:hypothetical protein